MLYRYVIYSRVLYRLAVIFLKLDIREIRVHQVREVISGFRFQCAIEKRHDIKTHFCFRTYTVRRKLSFFFLTTQRQRDMCIRNVFFFIFEYFLSMCHVHLPVLHSVYIRCYFFITYFLLTHNLLLVPFRRQLVNKANNLLFRSTSAEGRHAT